MSVRSQAERIHRSVQQWSELCEELSLPVIMDLLRRARFTTKPDGTPGNTRPTEIHTGASDDPLLAVAERRIDFDETQRLLSQRQQAQEAGDRSLVRLLDEQLKRLRTEADPLLAHIEEIFGTLAEISGHARRVHRLRAVVVNAGALLKDADSPLAICQACERIVAQTAEDRLRSGYCDACRKAWDREQHPRDRARFENKRQSEVKAERSRREDDAIAQLRQAASQLPPPCPG